MPIYTSCQFCVFLKTLIDQGLESKNKQSLSSSHDRAKVPEADPGFPVGGTPTLRGRGGVSRGAPLDPPLDSMGVSRSFITRNYGTFSFRFAAICERRSKFLFSLF